MVREDNIGRICGLDMNCMEKVFLCRKLTHKPP